MTKTVNRWSQDEVSFAIENYGVIPDEAIAEKLGRSVAAVQVKVSSLRKVARAKGGARPGVSLFSLHEAVCNLVKRVESIEARLAAVEKVFRDNPKTAVDNATFIREHYATMSRKQMAEATGLTVSGVADHMWRMCLKKYDKHPSPSVL